MQRQMGSTVRVLPCRAEDLPAIFDLLVQLQEAAPTAETLDLDRVRRLLAEMDREPWLYVNLCAHCGTRIVGFLSLVCYKTLYHQGGTALINELIVDRAYRRAGVGRALIDAARAAASERGLDELEVATEAFNADAQAFYRRCGFDQEYVLFGMELSD